MLRILCLSIFCWVGPILAHAQTTPGSAYSSEYDKLVENAVREYRERNFPEARSLFARAHAVSPNARTLRGLGMTELELRNYADSIDLLKRALDSQVRPLDGQLRSETVTLLERAESFVGRLTIEATPLPSAVSVNDVPTPLRDGRTLTLTVGDHLLELRAPGFAPEKRAVKVRGGEHETLRLAWSRPDGSSVPPVAVLPAPVPPPAPYQVQQPYQAPQAPQRDADPRRPLYKNPWLWTGIGVVVAGAAVGLALGLRKDSTTADPIVSDPFAIRKLP